MKEANLKMLEVYKFSGFKVVYKGVKYINNRRRFHFAAGNGTNFYLRVIDLRDVGLWKRV